MPTKILIIGMDSSNSAAKHGKSTPGTNSDLEDDDYAMDVEKTTYLRPMRSGYAQMRNLFMELPAFRDCYQIRQEKTSSETLFDYRYEDPETIVKQTTYPFLIKSGDIQIEDWLSVKFFCNSNEPGTSKNLTRVYIGRVTEIYADYSFKGLFLSSNISSLRSRFLHRYAYVGHISTFTHYQIVHKLQPPHRLKGGLLQFETDN